MRLLIVEDELDILYALQKGLAQEGYAVDIACDGNEAGELIETNDYDLIVLDINLPDIDGYTILNGLRANNKDIMVIIVSANREIDDRIKGLDFGANDYLIKPFDFHELKARIRALLRRDYGNISSIINAKELAINLATHKVMFCGQEILLTLKEYSILTYLVKNKNRIVSAEELFNHIWNDDADPFSQVVRVHVYSLRKKLAVVMGTSHVISTVKGAGYLFEEAADA